MRLKHKFLKLILALTFLIQPLIPTASASSEALSSDDQAVESDASLSEIDDEYMPVYIDEDKQLDQVLGEQEHPSIEDLYEQLQEHEQIDDGEGGFYELVLIEDMIPEEDLERVMDELNSEEGYSTVTDWALFNIDGEQLPTPRTHVVRHQRFLGTASNTSYHFRHITNFLGPSSGAGWRMETWQINIGGTWVRAFCTQMGIASAEPGNNNLPGWDQSNTGGLTQVQRETIGMILSHGYRNIHRPPTSNSENWIFPLGSGADALLDDTILTTQILIWEVTTGAWTWNNITSGTRSPIASGSRGDMWRRLVANNETSSGMEGGVTGNTWNSATQTNLNHRSAIGSVRRMDMYDAIRHDIYFFHRRNNRPQGTSASSTTGNRPVHTLTWSNTHQMYRTEIDDRIASNGSGTLRRFFGNRTSGSLGNGYRFCRGTQTNGVCNPSITSNRLIIYTRDSSAPPMNSASDLMNWNPTGNRDRAVGFFVNPQFQNKVVGAMQDPLYAYFRVQVTPRSRPPVQAIKYSNATNGRLAGARIELCRGSSTNIAGQTSDTSISSATDWCWEVTTNKDGVANFPNNGTLVSKGGNKFEGMIPNRRYRVREISAPEGYILPPLAERTSWVEVGTGGATATRTTTFRNDPIMGRVRINKIGNQIVGFEDDIQGDDTTPEVDVEDVVAHEEQPNLYEPETYEETSYGILVRARNWFGRLFNSDDESENETIIIDENTNPPHLVNPITPMPQDGVRWIFEDLPIEGVRFNIYARDNIVLPNGTIYHEAGDFVGYYYTDADGFIESDSLHLGNYFIREVSAPNGWYIDNVEIDFSLVYEDQYTEIVFADLDVENEWMTVEINLLKVGEVFGGHLDLTNTFTNLEGVHFGLFAGEDFQFSSGQSMPAGTLIEGGFTDSDGSLQFNRELPLGTFYVQEIMVGDHYVIDDTRHYFEHTGDVQDLPHLEIEVGSLERVYNYFVRGSFEIIKVSRDLPYVQEVDSENEENEIMPDDDNDIHEASDIDQESIDINDLDTLISELDITGPFLANVHFELWNLDLDEYVATFITDADGRIFVDGLIYGNYRLTEIVTDPHHQLNTDSIYFTIDREHQSHSWLVTNYKTNTNILKVDDLGEPLVGAHFQVIEVATNEIVEEWVSTDEPHVILGLHHGEHILRETQAPAGFRLGEDIYFTVTDSQDPLIIVAENLLDSYVYIGTQAHVGDGSHQDFVLGDTITAYDDIEITHINIRPETPRAFKAYKFIRLTNGETILYYETDYMEYTVENVLEFMVDEPNKKGFQVSTQIDTSQFPNMAFTFWAETAYHQNDEGEWIEDYRHNFDGSDQNQTLFPTTQTGDQLPQTGARNSNIIWVGVVLLVTGIGYAYYHKKHKKTSKAMK